jgi:DNA-binding Xre family transcriptional regulator
MSDCIKNGRISYIKLFKLLLDRRMKKGDLCTLSGISHSSLAKLGKGDNVNTDVLIKVCLALDVDLQDIMELEKLRDE